MKTLYIVRHAKSSWDDPLMDDFLRPLNERGKRDAPRMAKRLKEKEILPDIMVSSPAKRALSTCKRIAEVLGYEKGRIKTVQGLYHADEETMMGIVRGLDEKIETALLVGHNPGLTEFVNALTGQGILNVPTCGVVVISVDTPWKDLAWGGGKLVFYDYPKLKG